MLNIGDILQNRYQVMALLGQGGMGAVYHAWDTRLNIPVALKEMTPQLGMDSQVLTDLRSQFQQEATVLARLNHPNLVGVTDFFEESRNLYLVMQFVEGDSLSERIQKEGALPEEQVRAWAAQLLEAISYCHSQGVIHRDIKPQNIIITPNGDAVLVDFGLVKLWDPNDPRTRTVVRGMGSPQYSPPEQYEMDFGHTESRSDIYSIGATLYHALTGLTPPSATMRIAAPERFRPIREVVRGVSTSTIRAVETAMELARSQRWSSAVEMAAAMGLSIRSWGESRDIGTRGATQVIGTQPARGARTTGSLIQTLRRKPWWSGGLVGIIGVLLVGGGLFIVGPLRPAKPLPPPTATPSATLPPNTETSTATATRTLAPTETSTPLPSSTATATQDIKAQQPTSTLRVTGTPVIETPTPTETPTPAPTSQPVTPSPTVKATSTPQATSELPAPTDAPSPAASGALLNFENFGTWRRGDQPYGTFTASQEQVKTGSYAGKLAYNFAGSTSSDSFVVFLQSRAIGGQPNMFAAWVYGDGSGHYLNLWVQDAQSEILAIHLGEVWHTGWQQMSGAVVAGTGSWPAGHVSGTDNGRVDYPIRFYGIVLDRPDRGAGSGAIYVDDVTAWAAAAPAPNPTTTPVVAQPTVAPTSAPVAGGSIGSIIFTVKVGEDYYLYSADPGGSQMTEIGKTDYGHSTCAGGSTVSTLTGQVISVYGINKCNITERTDVCTSPDGQYKLITNFTEDALDWTVNMQSVADGSDQWYYQGKLNRDYGIQWSSNSRYVLFGVQNTVNVIPAGASSYQQVISYMSYDWPPQFAPNGSLIYFLRPVGSEGASDIFVVNVDGTGERNITNAPIAHKFCPRWRYP